MSLPWLGSLSSQWSMFYQIMRMYCKQKFYKEPDAQLASIWFSVISVEILVHVSVHFSDDLRSCSGLHGMDTFIFVVMDDCESEKSWLESKKLSKEWS